MIKHLRCGDKYDVSKFNVAYDYFQNRNPNVTNEDFKIIITKGIYPYEYMDSFEKNIESQLPSMDKFYSNLNNDTINENDYEHALKVWKTFNINHLGEYHDFYLMTDVRRCGSETPQWVRGGLRGSGGNFIGVALY